MKAPKMNICDFTTQNRLWQGEFQQNNKTRKVLAIREKSGYYREEYSFHNQFYF
jgi:hypothetical protein